LHCSSILSRSCCNASGMAQLPVPGVVGELAITDGDAVSTTVDIHIPYSLANKVVPNK